MDNLLDKLNHVRAGNPKAKKIMIYGEPDTGKTHLAGTIAKVPSIEKVYWFDLEGGIETLLYAKDSKGEPLLTPEEMQKIIPIEIADTQEYPLAAETCLKVFTARSPIALCLKHGSTTCKKCGVDDKINLNLRSQSLSTVIVLDSGSQMADSILAISQLANPDMDLLRLYGVAKVDTTSIISAIQAAPCNFIFITHELDLMRDKVNDRGRKIGETLVKTVPLVGSRNFSKKVGKAFGYKIYTYKRGEMRQATTQFKDKVLTGNRKPVYLDGNPDPSLEEVFAVEDSKPAEKVSLTPKVRI